MKTTRTNRTARQIDPPMGARPRFHPLSDEQRAKGARMWAEFLDRAAMTAPEQYAALIAEMARRP